MLQKRQLRILNKGCDTQQRMYYRNERTKQRWGSNPAHVVFLFIYTSVDDLRMTNWICRSLWIDTELPKQFAPHRFSGEEIGDGIIVEWSPNHQMLRNLSAQSTMSKEEYLNAIESLEKIVMQGPTVDAFLQINN